MTNKVLKIAASSDVRTHRVSLRFLSLVSCLVVGCQFALGPAVAWAQIRYTGVNLFGAEFGPVPVPGNTGNYFSDYIYPNAAEVDYFMGKGMNIFRLPFRWERLQQSAFAALNATELNRMDTFVNYATAQGAHVILDPHNFMRYFPDPDPSKFQSSTQGLVGTDSNVPTSAFQDFWSRLASHYKNNDKVMINLMNEPNAMSTADLVTIENAAIQSIRDADFNNLIMVPGNQYTGSWSWNETFYGGANAVHLLNIVDPIDNIAFEAHQYLDSDNSGTHENSLVSSTIGSERLQDFTNWLKANDLKGFLGEFAVGDQTIGNGAGQIGDEAINDMLGYIEANDDVWIGWTWWAAGPYFTDYAFSLEPSNLGQPDETDRIQMSVLEPHFVNNLLQDDANFNSDSDVDGDDFLLWQRNYGLEGQVDNSNGDANYSGKVDGDDLAVWETQYGTTGLLSAASTAVPEPAAGLLFSLSVIGCMGCWRHRSRPRSRYFR